MKPLLSRGAASTALFTAVSTLLSFEATTERDAAWDTLVSAVARAAEVSGTIEEELTTTAGSTARAEVGKASYITSSNIPIALFIVF